MDEFDKANAALTHAREYAKSQSELRAQHFHFFLIAISAVTAGMLSKTDTLRYLAAAGAVYSVASLMLDYRYKKLLNHAVRECARLEPLLDSHLSSVRGLPVTTIAYRLVYLCALAAFGVLIFASFR